MDFLFDTIEYHYFLFVPGDVVLQIPVCGNKVIIGTHRRPSLCYLAHNYNGHQTAALRYINLLSSLPHMLTPHRQLPIPTPEGAAV